MKHRKKIRNIEGKIRLYSETRSSPPFWDIVYISEVIGARKVKSDGQVAMNKNSDPMHIFFFRDGWWAVPELKFSKLLDLSKTSRSRKLISGLHVNIDKANRGKHDVIR